MTLAEVEREVSRHAPDVPIARAVHRAARVVTSDAKEPSWLEGKRVTLLSGVGHPEAFEETARALGADIRGVHIFDDHHTFSVSEVEGLCEEGTELLVTAKDAVKLRALGVPCASLEVELDIVAGEERLRDLVVATLRGTSSG